MRRQAGLSQRALAAKAGVSKTTIERTETGAADPTIATILKLVSAAGAQLQVTDLEATTFIFGIVEDQRDRAGRHAPPHRLSEAGYGWWDTAAEPHVRKALASHAADLSAFAAVARARREPR
jgi:transcriptional regulator with XRE-family HTH domain